MFLPQFFMQRRRSRLPKERIELICFCLERGRDRRPVSGAQGDEALVPFLKELGLRNDVRD